MPPEKKDPPSAPQTAAATPSEAELVAGLRRGERRALELAYARYRGRVYAFLVRLCGSGQRDLADDLFQETFVQLARHAPRLAADTELGAWLFTVARNRFRSQRRTALFRLDRLVTLFRGEPAPPPPTPHEQAAEREGAARLERALDALPADHREVLLLLCVEAMEQDQAARVLGLSPAALRKRLSRARAALAARLEKHEKLEKTDGTDRLRRSGGRDAG